MSLLESIRSLFSVDPVEQPEPDNSDDPVLEREVEDTTLVTKEFKEYKVTVSFSGDRPDKTAYVNSWKSKENSLLLWDKEPNLYAYHKLIHHIPHIEMEKGEPEIISFANTEDIDIEQRDTLVAVAEGVPIIRYETRESPDDEWSESYYEVADRDSLDEHDVEIWPDYEWEAYNA